VKFAIDGTHSCAKHEQLAQLAKTIRNRCIRIENQRDCLAQVSHAFFVCLALTISSRHLGAIGNEPLAILLYDYRELIPHLPYCSARYFQAPNSRSTVTNSPR
jgi:hypothetical protein